MSNSLIVEGIPKDSQTWSIDRKQTNDHHEQEDDDNDSKVNDDGSDPKVSQKSKDGKRVGIRLDLPVFAFVWNESFSDLILETPPAKLLMTCVMSWRYGLMNKVHRFMSFILFSHR